MMCEGKKIWVNDSEKLKRDNVVVVVSLCRCMKTRRSLDGDRVFKKNVMKTSQLLLLGSETLQMLFWFKTLQLLFWFKTLQMMLLGSETLQLLL
jgi:hypothetical protein